MNSLHQLNISIQNSNTVSALQQQQYWDTCSNLKNEILNAAIDVGQYKDIQMQKQSNAKTQNEQVTSTDVFDANIKAVNAIYFRNQNSSDLTQAEKDILYTIAYQCPFSGGVGVFQARAIISLFDDNIEYDDNTTCGLDGYEMRQSNNANKYEIL